MNILHSRKNRRWLLFAAVQLLAIAMVIFAFVYRGYIDSIEGSDRYSSCPFHDFVHLYCPGCGGTRAMIAIFQGRWIHSLLCNPVSLYLFLGFVAMDIRAALRIYRNQDRPVRVPMGYLWGLLGLSLANFMVRNVLLVVFGIDYLGDLLPFWHP